jgi:4-hydroxybenzoate polyprenyltransferase/phosphoserine phosphatase
MTAVIDNRTDVNRSGRLHESSNGRPAWGERRAAGATESPDGPVCVDLDGTLVRTDTLIEGILSLGLNRCLVKASLLLLLGRGAAFKEFVAREGEINPALLPYNERLLSWLYEQKARGRRLILATAADIRVARAVADHLGIFDDVIASDGVQNNKGTKKAKALIQRYGAGNFTYVGNGRADLSVWRAARKGVIVNARAGVLAAACRVAGLTLKIDDRPSVAPAIWRAVRPYQWVKNLLVFVPIVTAHALTELNAWTSGAMMFAAFCAAASGIYLINDISDLSSDRLHFRKRHRPFASGALPIPLGVALVPVLLGLGCALSAAVGALWVILAYIALSLSYSLKLKEKPLVDVFILAALYTVRLVGGGEATGYVLSLWLLAFSSFIFLSLAFIKRVEELRALNESSPGSSTPRRGYKTGDLGILQLFGCCASFSSSIVLALYVQDQVAQHTASILLWGIVPLMLFWQCRLWLTTARGNMHYDPIIYAAHDWVSWLVALGLITMLSVASSRLLVGF